MGTGQSIPDTGSATWDARYQRTAEASRKDKGLSSSGLAGVKHKQTPPREGIIPERGSAPCSTGRDLPRSVLGPARSCWNLSSREASLSLNAELLRVLGSGVPPSATVTECGRDWDL